MPSPRPYRPHYPADWQMSSTTRKMTLAAQMIYMKLLDIQWEEGHVDDNLDDMRAMVGASVEEFEQFARFVDKCFPICDDGKRRNPRLDSDRTNIIQKVETNKTNGNLGGRPRKTKPDPTEEPNQNPNPSSGKPNENPTVNPTKTQPKPNKESDKELNTTAATARATPQPPDSDDSPPMSPLAAKLAPILQQIPAVDRCGPPGLDGIDEVLTDYGESVKVKDWPEVAKSCRDHFRAIPAFGVGSVKSASAAGLLREFVRDRWLPSRKLPAKSGSRSGLDEIPDDVWEKANQAVTGGR